MSKRVYRAGDRVRIDAIVTDAGVGWVGVRLGEFGKSVTADPSLVQFISHAFTEGEMVHFLGEAEDRAYRVLTTTGDWVVAMPMWDGPIPDKPVIAKAVEFALVEEPGEASVEPPVPPSEVTDT